jgi:hypothetical protein
MSLDLEVFSYNKWGSLQHGKKGDWLVENNGDVYTVDQESFAATYQSLSPGRYIKIAPVWAKKATSAGSIATKEGNSDYDIGDYLVYNQEGQQDGYAMKADKFESMYEPLSDPLA